MSTATHDNHAGDDTTTDVAVDQEPELVGLMAEFRDIDAIFRGARGVRQAGFSRWDVHTPFPIHGIDSVMGTRATILPWIVAGGGITGLLFGLLLQWYVNAFDYQFMISGKPYWSLPANIPVIFECTVLFSALTAVFGMLGLNGLPMLYNPLFKSERFRRVTNDRFFIVLDASDPKFDERESSELLTRLGAMMVERVVD